MRVKSRKMKIYMRWSGGEGRWKEEGKCLYLHVQYTMYVDEDVNVNVNVSVCMCSAMDNRLWTMIFWWFIAVMIILVMECDANITLKRHSPLVHILQNAQTKGSTKPSKKPLEMLNEPLEKVAWINKTNKQTIKRIGMINEMVKYLLTTGLCSV